MRPEIRVESVFRAARSPYSTDAVAFARVEARLFASESAPRIGRFILSERVGRGGMGTVYAAFDPQLGRRVAVKILHPELSGVRLLREAQAMARLRHPNLLTIYEVGEYQHQAYIAMEFIDGHSLGELQRSGRIDWRRWLAYYLVAGRGLAAAHRGRLVHRDFKPDNVLVDRDGRVVVADFGLAKRSDEPAAVDDDDPTPPLDDRLLTRPGVQPGTTRYMAPEQFVGQASDARSDQYSFCTALWEAIHGEIPLAPHERGEPQSWQALALERHRTPAWLRRVLMRGLHPTPASRWPTMEALLAALDNDPAKRWPMRAMLVTVMGLLFAWSYAYLASRWRAEQAELQTEIVQAQGALEVARAEQRNLDTWFVQAAMQEPDPTIRAVMLTAVTDPEATPQWRNTATDTLLRPVSLAVLRGHAGELRGATFSPDGRKVATASYDHEVRIWNVDGTGVPLVLRGHTDRVLGVLFTADGRHLISTSEDGTARVWDLLGKEATQVLRGHDGAVYEPALAPDGQTLATCDAGGSIRLWRRDAVGFQLQEVLRGHTDEVFYVEFSPDGRRLVSASRDRTARVWSLESMRSLHVLRSESQVIRAHFSPNGATVVTAPGNSQGHLWRVADGKRLLALHADKGGVADAVFSPDGGRLVTMGRDRIAKVIDTRTGKRIRDLPLPHHGSAVAISHDGSNIAVATAVGEILLWPGDSGGGAYRLVGHEGTIHRLAFDPGDRYLLSSSSDRTARVWDVGAIRASSADIQVEGMPLLEDIFMEADSVLLASKDVLSVNDVATGRIKHQRRVPEGEILGHRIGLSGEHLAAITTGRTAYLWDLSHGGEPLRLARDVSTLTFLHDERLVVGHWNGDVSLFTTDGELLARRSGHTEEIQHFSGIFDGRYIASLGRDGRLIRWDVTDGLSGRELAATGSRLHADASCVDRGILAIADTRHPRVLLWDIPRGVQIGEISLDESVPLWLALDCRHGVVAVQTREGTLQLWTTSGKWRAEKPRMYTAAGRMTFYPERSLLLVSQRQGDIQILDVRDLSEYASVKGGSADGFLVARDGSLLVMNRERGLVRIDLDSVLRTVPELHAELRRRTTACPALAVWRALYFDDEGRARWTAAGCELRSGRSPLAALLGVAP